VDPEFKTDTVPAGQVLHVEIELAPTAVLYLPEGQPVHTVEPELLYVPGSQLVHDFEPGALYLPSEQVRHEVKPGEILYCPPLQAVQILWPLVVV
jgi:hypothetical protein